MLSPQLHRLTPALSSVAARSTVLTAVRADGGAVRGSAAQHVRREAPVRVHVHVLLLLAQQGVVHQRQLHTN